MSAAQRKPKVKPRPNSRAKPAAKKTAKKTAKPAAKKAAKPAAKKTAKKTAKPTTKPRLSHVDAAGAATMVDVSPKAPTARRAIAEGRITMSAAAFAAVKANRVKKGDVLGVARLAGIQAAKRTAELIPLCHPLPLTDVQVVLTLDAKRHAVRVETSVATVAPTGVEMEALAAASVALLTIYDMVKALDKAMVIERVRLLEKTGGKSGTYKVRRTR